MKLTQDSRKQIYDLIQEGVGKGAIAAKFGTSVSQVSKIGREFSPDTVSAELEAPEIPKSAPPTPSKPSPRKKSKKKVKTPEVEATVTPATSSGSAGTDTCTRCGKPLSKDTSITAGMGDICQSHTAALAGLSFESYREYKASLELEKEPDEFWLPLGEALAIAKEKQAITTARFMCAVGENRHLKPPIDPVFQVRWWKNRRYILKKSVMQAKNLNLLADAYEIRRQLETEEKS